MIMNHRFIRFAIGFTAIAASAAGSVLVWALNEPGPPSLYRPELKREMSQEQRWALDLEMANEVTSQVNSRRFDGLEGLDKRARWIEKEAVTYQIADLIQQIMNVTFSKARNNEKAFNQLVELGQQGDVGASCMANLLYQHHRQEDTVHWKYSRDDVTRLALKAKAASGHPVCAGLESRFYMRGEMGYPMDREKAKPFVIEGAVAGFFGDQSYLIAIHRNKTQIMDPKEVELQLCWMRVADRFSPMSSFADSCESFRRGWASDSDLKQVDVPQHITELARKWCHPTQEQWKVTAQDCANLESK